MLAAVAGLGCGTAGIDHRRPASPIRNVHQVKAGARYDVIVSEGAVSDAPAAWTNALAEGGKRVLLWDRPNCGRSDIQLYGVSESHMRAETLGLMLNELGIEQVIASGGSGGARDSIIFTMMWPELVTKLAVWSIVGGT